MLSFNSCKKEKLLNTKETIVNFDVLKNSSSSEIEKEEYDKNLRKFAKALAKSLKHEDLRKKIKDEAMLKIDGDYDIIWKEFNSTKIKTDKGEINLTELIAENSDEKDKTKKEKIFDLEKFSSNCKGLQIAVPVNCNKWDTETFQPIVVFLTADYDESQEQICGFDGQGNEVVISNIIVPEFPVVVLGLNERSDSNGDILNRFKVVPIEDDEPCSTPPATPTSLAATTTGNSIMLTWNQVLPPDITCLIGYKIYRKGEGENSFTLIGQNSNRADRVYYDSQFEASDANRSFSYYVTSIGIGGESYESNTAVAPNVPNPVISFTVTNYSYRTAFLNWDNNTSDYHSETRIYRTIVNSNPYFELYKSYTDNTSDFFDTNLTSGYRYHYRIVHVNGIDESNARYDFVQIPYRAINTNSPVYVKNISFTDWDLESWPAGKPEFRIWVANGDKISGFKDFIVGDIDKDSGRHYDFSSVTKSQDFTENALFNWNPGYWEDIVAIRVIEHDEDWGDDSKASSIGVKINYKDTLNANINGELIGQLSFNYEDHSEDCGTTYYSYFDNSFIELSAGFNYGLKLTIDISN